MAIQLAKSRAKELVLNLGQAGIHAVFPNDFEYYMCAFELVDGNGFVIDALVFPVMPENISYSEPQITSIRKTMSGITALSTSTFVPKDIQITGNFGRELKILIGQKQISITKTNNSIQNGIFNKISEFVKNQSFDPRIKTGYGIIKILQAICDKSTGVDDNNNSNELYFYNAALGESHIVKVMSLTLNQDYSMNRIWSYTLQLRAVAPLQLIKGKEDSVKSLIKLMSIDALQKAATGVVRDLISFTQTKAVKSVQLSDIKKARRAGGN